MPLRSHRHPPTPLSYILVGILIVWGSFSLLGYQQVSSSGTPEPTSLLPTSEATVIPNPTISGPIVDPISNVVPQADPTIEALLEEVSAQNLMAYVIKLESFGTRNSFSLTDRDDFGIGGAKRWLFSEFERVGGERLQVEWQEFSFDFLGLATTQQNIMATLPGTDEKAGIVMMVAHYDTSLFDPRDGENLMAGADDNGSSLAAMLEIVRLLSGRSWKQTIVFLATASEEQGNYGSQYFVRQALLNGWPIEAVLNNDMIGGRRGISPSVRVFSQGPDTSLPRQLARYVDYVGGLYLPTFPVTIESTMDREGRWSDHVPFTQAGFPAVRMIESEEDLTIQSSNRDVWSLLDFAYLQKMTQLNLVVLASLAEGPARPELPLIRALAEPGSYRLDWTMAGDAAAYAISFRPLGELRYPPFHVVMASQAGHVILTGLTNPQGYAVSLAAINENGCIGTFSPEILVTDNITPQ